MHDGGEIMTFIDSVITGLAVGLGSTIGTYLASRHVISKMEKFEKMLANKLKAETQTPEVNHHLTS